MTIRQHPVYQRLENLYLECEADLAEERELVAQLKGRLEECVLAFGEYSRENEALRRKISEILHIIETAGFVLIGPDGQPIRRI